MFVVEQRPQQVIPPLSVMETRSILERREKIDYRHYKARKLVGSGTYGDVILCERSEDAPRGRSERVELLVALKRVRRARNDDADEKLREQSIRNEARILSQVRHPFIIEKLFALKRADFFYLGLEYCPGGDLFTALCNDLPMSKLEACKYLVEISFALEYLRERRIIHRDIKPENIALKGGSCKLIDFGNAFVLKDDDNMVVTTSGTMPYAAPEILEREPHRYEVDLWSFGVLACEMLTQTSPFGNTDVLSNAEMCAAICTEPPTIPHDTDQDTRDFLLKLMQKEQTCRLGYKSVREVREHSIFDQALLKDVALAPMSSVQPMNNI